MKTLFLALSILAAGLASAQTNDPHLPDAAIRSYSGDVTITQYLATSDMNTSVGGSGSAVCAQQGIQGSPGSYAGFFIGGFIEYRNNPSYRLPDSCGPLQVEIDGIESNYNPNFPYGLYDHLEQVLAVQALGSLPSPPAPFPGFPAVINQLEACSLVGDPPYFALGQPHTFIRRPGLCWFYDGTGSTIQSCEICQF